MALSETLEVTLWLAGVLEQLGVPYLVGGSLASSLHGIPRATQDVDLVAVLGEPHVAGLVAALAGEFYVDAEMIREAIRHRSCFNVIHLATMFKLDVFVFDGSELATEELARARPVQVADDPPRRLVVASAEDIVLQKLVWYRLGNRVSDRQWADLLGVLLVQGSSLDFDYLQQWAARLGLDGLLAEARAEAAG